MIKALVVEDEADVREAVGEVVASFGHEYDSAADQSGAWELLRKNRYDYLLLDLEIPVRPGGFPRRENGVRLLERILQERTLHHLPVIVVTSHGKEGPRLAVEVMRSGAVDFVNKPFDDGELDAAIQRLLAKHLPREPEDKESLPPPSPFRGGTLALHTDRAELCGVEIRRNDGRGHAWKVLKLLALKRDDGRYVAYSSARLKAELGAEQNATVQCVNDLRKKIAELLLRERNVACRTQDVILSGGQGYRLNPWIVVEQVTPHAELAGHNGIAAVVRRGDTADVPGDIDGDPGDTSNVPGHDVDLAVEPLNDRQEWVLAQLKDGKKIRRRNIEAAFGCSDKTAKRDLRALQAKGLVRFHGAGAEGHYAAVPHEEPTPIRVQPRNAPTQPAQVELMQQGGVIRRGRR